MIVIEQRSEVGFSPVAQAELIVDPKDINFHDVSPGVVRIEVRIRNEGEGRSEPTTMRLESAVLGAFVPWRPLAVLPVPALEPGESRVLRLDVPRPRPALLGAFDRTPPAKMLTAISSPDQPMPRPGAGLGSLSNLLQRPTPTTPRLRGGGFSALLALAPDLQDMVGAGNPHWAGNINVFVNRTPVERHVARALRVYPGRANLAMFVVGGGSKSDAYSFEFAGLGAGWKAELFDVTRRKTLVPDRADRPFQETQWVEGTGSMIIMLATKPPEGCREGRVEVRVTRRSSGKTAVVEFTLDPAAQGAGCYSA